MVTLKADESRRVEIPDAKPGQIFVYDHQADGSVVLTPVEAERQEPFPPGSLAYLCTQERDEEMTAIAKATVVGVPKDYAGE